MLFCTYHYPFATASLKVAAINRNLLGSTCGTYILGQEAQHVRGCLITYVIMLTFKGTITYPALQPHKVVVSMSRSSVGEEGTVDLLFPDG